MSNIKMKFLNQFGSTEKNAPSALPGEGSGEIGHDRMTATSLSAASNKTGTSGTCHVSSRHRKHRSWSTTRCEDKPRKKKHNMGSGSTSLVSIPNAIKLSMLNTGLISFELQMEKNHPSKERKMEYNEVVEEGEERFTCSNLMSKAEQRKKKQITKLQ
ncbi:hypothetical protein RUM44_005626 [Polyplax serrata]|uniref:Uncharacterized protein n=1 Tax=Polyplax serrata TaxID=468196 RepID=A0ABR1ADY9_POLSC